MWGIMYVMYATIASMVASNMVGSHRGHMLCEVTLLSARACRCIASRTCLDATFAGAAPPTHRARHSLMQMGGAASATQHGDCNP